MSEGGREPPDIEALRFTLEESRRVLDHQLSMLNDIDDKAIRTVRLAILLIALIVSVGQLMGSSQVAGLHLLVITSVGISLILLAMVVFFGIGVYDTSNVPFGISNSHREELLQESYAEREWLEILLEEYGQWAASTRETTENNAKWQSRLQVFLLVAITYLFASAVPVFTPLSAPTTFILFTGLAGVALIISLAIARYRNDD